MCKLEQTEKDQLITVESVAFRTKHFVTDKYFLIAVSKLWTTILPPMGLNLRTSACKAKALPPQPQQTTELGIEELPTY